MFKTKYGTLRNGGSDGEEAGVRRILERREERREVAAQARVQHKSWFVLEGIMRDVSESGCRIELASVAGRVGQRIFVYVNGLEPWPGIIRWIGDDAMGINFTKPLYSPIVDHLARTLAPIRVGSDVGILRRPLRR